MKSNIVVDKVREAELEKKTLLPESLHQFV